MTTLCFLNSTPAAIIGILVFVCLIIFYSIGYRLRHKLSNDRDTSSDLGAMSGTLLGLLALLLAFAFGIANSRYDARRAIVIEEANAIGTVVLRTDIFADSFRHVLRSKLRLYLEARIAYIDAGADEFKTRQSLRLSDSLGQDVWKLVARYARDHETTARTSQLIPALNDMLDVATSRDAAREASIPDSIMYFLMILCCCVAFLLGYDRRNKFDWIVVIGFALMLSITVFTVLDLDRPYRGFIDLKKSNQKILNLQEMFENDD